MKKILAFMVAFLLTATLSACFWKDSNSQQTIPNDNGVVESGINENTEETIEDESANEPVEDVRDEPKVIRQEIANMLRDAESLINANMYDDAKSVLRNLRSRELTDPEKKKVDELASRLIKISD